MSILRKPWCKALVLPALFCLQAVFQPAASQSLSPSDTADVRFLNGRKFFIYEVKKGETLFSISRKFEIPEDELTEINPEISKGLKPRMDLWVPAYSWKNLPRGSKDEQAKPEGRPRETRNSVHIALISDLSLAKVYSVEPDPADSSVYERIDKSIRSNLEFVEGARTAMERFHRSNPSVKLRTSVIDSESDTVHLARLLSKYDFRKADIWITNETGPTLSYLSRLSERNGVLLVSCGINTYERIEKNPDAVSLLPSSLLQCRRMGAWAAGHFKSACAVFVKTSNPKETERMNAMKEGWLSVSSAGPVRIADYSKGFGKAVVDSLRTSRKNVVFVSSSNEDMITGLLLAMKERKSTTEFSVVGLPTWYAFETLDPGLMQACDVFYFNSGSIEFRPDHAVEFRQLFRDTYNTEPGETAYIGYDAAGMILELRKKYGADVFRKELPSGPYEGIYSEYRFRRPEKDGSCENHNISVWNFKDVIPHRVDD